MPCCCPQQLFDFADLESCSFAVAVISQLQAYTWTEAQPQPSSELTATSHIVLKIPFGVWLCDAGASCAEAEMAASHDCQPTAKQAQSSAVYSCSGGAP